MTFKTTLIEALNCADRIICGMPDGVGWEVDEFAVNGKLVTLTMDDGHEKVQLRDAEVEIDENGFVSGFSVEGEVVELSFYIEDSRPLNEWDIQVPCSQTEREAQKAWQNVCNAQGWNEDSQIIHLEGFIEREGLFKRFAEYAERAAREENADSLQVYQQALKGDEATVHSSHGDVVIDVNTGAVVRVELNDSEDEEGWPIAAIACFDMDEYFAHYKDESREKIRDFDILDLGYTNANGSKVEPDQDFRASAAQALKDFKEYKA